MAEVGPYTLTPTPDGEIEPFRSLVVAHDEKLIGGEIPAYSWVPDIASHGSRDTIDVALVEKRGTASIVFQPFGGRRSTLPISIPFEDLDPDQWMVEERADHMIVVRVSGITAFDVHGEDEAFLVAWDDKKRAPVKVKYWKGLYDMPAWAIPQD